MSEQAVAQWDRNRRVWIRSGRQTGQSGLFSETWPTSGSMRSGRLFPRTPPARLTAAPECSLLPTPIASDSSRSLNLARRTGGQSLVDAILGTGLVDEAAFTAAVETLPWLPRDSKYREAIQGWESLTRPAPSPVMRRPLGRRPRVNPAFPEWMMGWPAGWVTNTSRMISRPDQLWIIGNGVCPQQAAIALDLLGVSA